jgi:carboxymethylenebutenolidase
LGCKNLKTGLWKKQFKLDNKKYHMKKTALTIIASAGFLLLFSQKKTTGNAMSCCGIDATQSFARNAAAKEFVMSHDEPLPFTYESQNGEYVKFITPDGTYATGWEIKAKQKTNYYIFVIQEWWGLNDYIKKQSETLWSDLGLNVIALDMYDGKLATTRDSAAAYMQAVKKNRLEDIIKGAIMYAGKKAKIFTVGWCFGGGWSLQATLLAGRQAAGGIMYYGQPEKEVKKLKTLKVDVMGFFGNKDQWPAPAVIDEFEKNMQKAGKKLIVNRYEANHAFANPSNPNFDKEATEDAYRKLLEFVNARMKLK